MPQTLTARRTNLARANEVRLAIAAIKCEITSGQLSFVAAVYDPRAQAMSVGALLDAVPRLGTRRVDAICSALMISPDRRIRELSMRQKGLVARAALNPVTRRNRRALSVAAAGGELVIT